MAGQIPQHFIDDLLTRIDIVDVINLRVPLKKAGSSYKACCPFHSEKTPSFTVSQPKQFYHCFGCGVNGNAISFLMAYENLHFVDAIEMLAESLGLDVPREGGTAAPRHDHKPLYELLTSVSTFYQRCLRETPAAIDYLKDRGISGRTCKRFGIGYAPDGWDALGKAFARDEAALVKTGMLKYSDEAPAGGRQARAYQRFRARLMFPIHDRRGRVIAFGGRLLGQGEPKYLNSPETPLFQKAGELYGLSEARRAAQDAGRVIVVEGYMDVVALAEHGVENAVATLGTAANRQHSEALFRLVPEIVFCFDGDRAGRAAAWRALTATLPCLSDGRDAYFLFLPDGEDPDSIVNSRGAEGFAELLEQRMPIIEFLFRHLAEDIDLKGIGGKAALADKARPLLATLPQGAYRQLAYRELDRRVGVSLGGGRAAPAPPAPRAPVREDTGLTPMRRAVLLILQQPACVARLPPEAFEFDQSLPGADVLSRLIGYCDSDSSITAGRLLERFRDQPGTRKFLARLAQRDYWPDGRELDLQTAEADLQHCLQQLREQSRHGADSERIPPQLRRAGLLGIRGGQPGPKKPH